MDLNFLEHNFLGEKVTDLLWFAGIIIATLLLKRPLAALLARLSSGLSTRLNYLQYKVILRDMLNKPIERLLMTVLFYVAVNKLSHLLDSIVIHHIPGITKQVSVTMYDVTDHIFLLLFIVFLTRVIVNLIDFVFYLRMNTAHEEKDLANLQLLPLTKEVTRLVLWTLGIFWMMGSVFHVNVPALITGLGIGGVAIALAGKETVENFFAAFTLLSDKPFQIGDTIRIIDFEGVVERIGFRSSQIRNMDGSLCIIPNQKLVSQNVINLSNRDKTGVKLIANIRYGITSVSLQQMTEELKMTLSETVPLQEPIDVVVAGFDKETFQLSVSYILPYPLPANTNITALKKEVNMKIFATISKYATLGTTTSS